MRFGAFKAKKGTFLVVQELRICLPSAGNVGLIPGLRRFQVCAPQLLSLSSRAQEPPLLRPGRPRAGALQHENSLHGEVHTLRLEGGNFPACSS